MDHHTDRNKTRTMVYMAIMTAVICVLAPLSIPIGPIPFTFTNLAIFMSLYLLGWKKTLGSVLCYLIIGGVGVPVFSGFTGGLGKLVGPTGGFLVGFLPMALIGGMFIEKTDKRYWHFIGMAGGMAVCYFLGTAWYCYEAGVGVQAALRTCVLLFIPGDLIKILLSMYLGPVIYQSIRKAGLL